MNNIERLNHHKINHFYLLDRNPYSFFFGQNEDPDQPFNVKI